MTRPILYTFRRCPYAMRGRMAIAHSGIEVELRELILRDKPAHMLEISPKGTVPVVLLPDGEVLDESLDVAFWALRQNDQDDWLAPWVDDGDATKALVDENDGPFKHALDRYKYATRYEGVDPLEHRERGEVFLAKLNDRLSGQNWLFGDRFSFLDAAIAPFVRQFRMPDTDWFDTSSYEGVRDWLSRFVEHPAFTRVMKKYPLWAEDQDPITFPDR